MKDLPIRQWVHHLGQMTCATIPGDNLASAGYLAVRPGKNMGDSTNLWVRMHNFARKPLTARSHRISLLGDS
ncbi:MAG: hypothetical protein K2X81_05930, partial [Candidatus Obscuribacterales bacterium]|nr:hypothetical protein [Candidatus Obscuribacterales bacterium]